MAPPAAEVCRGSFIWAVVLGRLTVAREDNSIEGRAGAGRYSPVRSLCSIAQAAWCGPSSGGVSTRDLRGCCRVVSAWTGRFPKRRCRLLTSKRFCSVCRDYWVQPRSSTSLPTCLTSTAIRHSSSTGKPGWFLCKLIALYCESASPGKAIQATRGIDGVPCDWSDLPPWQSARWRTPGQLAERCRQRAT